MTSKIIAKYTFVTSNVCFDLITLLLFLVAIFIVRLLCCWRLVFVTRLGSENPSQLSQGKV